jgi:hypothetical protein
MNFRSTPRFLNISPDNFNEFKKLAGQRRPVGTLAKPVE